MAANILEIPFRRSQAVDLSSAIKTYISSKFDQEPATFEDDIQTIDALRNDAIHVHEPHKSGVDRLMKYIAQLRYMSGKFPLELGVEFAWWPALGFHTATPVIHNNLRYEACNIIYQLAALYSQLAYTNNRTTSDGLKQAAQYSVAASGTLNFLRKEMIPDMRTTPPEDMDEATLESLENMCLAQAQECYWGKAVKDSMRDGTISRLAACVSDYYSTAADFAIKSDAISTEWIHHFQAKHHHFAAAAQYRQSVDCLEKRKYGEEVARLRDSITCVNEALKEARWVNRTVLGDLNGLKQKVTEELKRAEKDNDVIYLLPVPAKSELKILDRANMVAPKPPKELADGISMLGPKGLFGRPLFEKLVPYAVHQAASIYSDRRDRLVSQSIIADLEAMTIKIRELLSSLNLPGSLQALEKPLGLPPSLISKAEELRQQDALYRLQRGVDDTAKLKTNDLVIFREGLDLLEAERAEDDRLRAKYGTDRWFRVPSLQALEKFYKQAADLQGYLNSAASSDSLVQTKMRGNEQTLRLLTGSTRDLERYVPSSRGLTVTPAIEQTSSRLRSVLNDVSKLESRRKRKIEAVKAKAKADDINSVLLVEAARLEREYPMQPIAAAQFESFFEARLENYEADREALVQEQEDQDQLLARLREANKNFIDARKGDTEKVTRDREKALQELETGYVKYKEIVSNLETGRKFYNDLAGHVGRFREAVRAAVAQRRQEANEAEAELGVGGMRLEERRELRGQKRREAATLAADTSHITPAKPEQAPPPKQEPLPAPVAARGGAAAPSTPPVITSVQTPMGPPMVPKAAVWSPDMGIRFGGPTSQANGQAGYPQPRRP